MTKQTSTPFTHLHVHSCYSLLDGAMKLGPALDRALELGMHSLAITDHGVLFGIADFYLQAKSKGIKPIIGCEAYVAPGDMTVHEKRDDNKVSYHLVLLCENEIGYYNLIQLISRAHLEGFYYKPRIDKRLLREHAEGLIGLSACLQGEVATELNKGNERRAEEVALDYADIFGKDRFFLELEDHGIPEQRAVNRRLIALAERTGLGLVATNDVHYLKREHAEAHDLLLCMQTQSTFNDPRRMRYYGDQFYLKSPQEMWDLFRECPSALHNTHEIAQRCNLEMRLNTKELHFPLFPLEQQGQTPRERLLELGAEGLRKHYGIEQFDRPADEREKSIVDRFLYELSIIEQTGFVNYFLVVQDFINEARKRQIAVGPGRGSGAGSLVAYALGITGIDPLYYKLIFERFLNPERVSPPDFDIDFCQWRRAEVIDYVRNKYGTENVAQVATFTTLGAKTVVRDIGRALEIPLAECNHMAKLIPEEVGITLERAIRDNPEFRALVETDPNAARIMKYAPVLEGFPRQTGVHAAGLVIGEKPLIEILPLARDKNGEVITQFEKGNMEATGLLKMDFLGLKTLTVIRETIRHIQDTHDRLIDIDHIPLDDEPTFELLRRGDSVCVFQLESKGMRDLLKNLGPTCIQDLIALIALYRPGPMEMIPDFIARKHGKVSIEYDHPLLEEVLQETYGVMIYQEQVQYAANLLAGYSLGEGDILRRAMGKKNAAVMAEQRATFIEGCKKTNQIPAKQAGEIFDRIEKFAGYGFNKSHSAAYGLISYQTAYLKAHYPVEFMAANLTLEMSNTDKLPIILAETREMDIDILPPSVNESLVHFRPIKRTIRFGLAGVKNVGEAAVQALVAERDAQGPYQGLTDFCRRLDGRIVNKKTLESLVACGAFDFTGLSRGRLFSGIEFALARAASDQRDRRTGQTTLFALFDEQNGHTNDDDELPETPAWPEHEMLAHEKELLGFYVSGHPLTEHEWTLNVYAKRRLSRIHELPPGSTTRVGGLVTGFRRMLTKKEQRAMCAFRLEGLEGALDVVVFADAYEKAQAYLHDGATVMLCGELDRSEEAKIKAAEVYRLDQAPDLFAKCAYIHLPEAAVNEQLYQNLRTLLRDHAGPVEVRICLQFPEGEKVFVSTGPNHRVRPDAAFAHAVNHLLGEDSIYIDVLAQVGLNTHKRRPRAAPYRR